MVVTSVEQPSITINDHDMQKITQHLPRTSSADMAEQQQTIKKAMLMSSFLYFSNSL